MNANVIRVLFRYNDWAQSRLWGCVEQVGADDFTRDTGYSVGSLRDHLVHVASVDNRWFARVRGVAVPRHFDPFDFVSTQDVKRLHEVVYRDIGHYLDDLPDARLYEDIAYTSRGTSHTSPAWKILLHVLNHATDHRAQMLYALHKFGAGTFEQDFTYYLRDETPPREGVRVQADVLQALFAYDAYTTSRLVAETLANLTDTQLDQAFGYSHDTLRKQLGHLLVSSQYWLNRAVNAEIPGDLSAVLVAGVQEVAKLNDRELLEPVEYVTAGGLAAVNIRWEMLWHLINHGTDHRAQALAFAHAIGADTFEQDMMIYFWDHEL